MTTADFFKYFVEGGGGGHV